MTVQSGGKLKEAKDSKLVSYRTNWKKKYMYQCFLSLVWSMPREQLIKQEKKTEE